MQGLGGGVWAQLKADDTKFPPAKDLLKAQLWDKPDLYKHSVWTWLCNPDGGDASVAASKLPTQSGVLHQLDVTTGNRAEKLLVGPLSAIMACRTEATMVLCEVGTQENFWPPELNYMAEHGSKQRQGVRLAVWGTCDAVRKVDTGPIAERTAAGGLLTGYKRRCLAVHLSEDDPLPGRPPWSTNVSRSVLLVSPHSFKNCPDYMVTQMGWTASLVVHIKNVLDIIRTILSGFCGPCM